MIPKLRHKDMAIRRTDFFIVFVEFVVCEFVFLVRMSWIRRSVCIAVECESPTCGIGHKVTNKFYHQPCFLSYFMIKTEVLLCVVAVSQFLCVILHRK